MQVCVEKDGCIAASVDDVKGVILISVLLSRDINNGTSTRPLLPLLQEQALPKVEV